MIDALTDRGVPCPGVMIHAIVKVMSSAGVSISVTRDAHALMSSPPISSGLLVMPYNPSDHEITKQVSIFEPVPNIWFEWLLVSLSLSYIITIIRFILRSY